MIHVLGGPFFFLLLVIWITSYRPDQDGVAIAMQSPSCLFPSCRSPLVAASYLAPESLRLTTCSSHPLFSSAYQEGKEDPQLVLPQILLENDHVLVINKPCHMAHHDRKNHHQQPPRIRPTTTSFVPAYHVDDDDDGDDDEEEGVVQIVGEEDENRDDDGGNRHSRRGAMNEPEGQQQAEVEEGVLTWLRHLQRTGHLNYTGRLYGVHRLDRVTSGILVLAKHAAAAAYLTAAFRRRPHEGGGDNGGIVKYYTGLSLQAPKQKKQGWIQGGMVRGRRKSWMLTKIPSSSSSSSSPSNPAPLWAKTRFFTAGLGHVWTPPTQSPPKQVPGETMSSTRHPTRSEAAASDAPPRTLLLMRPYTGRTHQLRVAAKSVGLPLAGDPIYRDHLGSYNFLTRTYLHATALYIPDHLLTTTTAGGIEDGTVTAPWFGEGPWTIWSHPPFVEDWESLTDHTNNNSMATRNTFDQILHTLMHKHCDCAEILDQMNKIIP